MTDPVAQGLLAVLMVLGVFVYPAVCISRIAARLGKSPLRYGLCSLVPLGSLVAIGVLAFAAPQRAYQARR